VDDTAGCELRIGDGFRHGTHPRSRDVTRLQELLPVLRGADSQDNPTACPKKINDLSDCNVPRKGPGHSMGTSSQSRGVRTEDGLFAPRRLARFGPSGPAQNNAPAPAPRASVRLFTEGIPLRCANCGQLAAVASCRCGRISFRRNPGRAR
jgi:hypothetical protein